MPAPHFEVREALPAKTVWRWRRSDPPDVILLDLLMPGVDGYEVLTQLQKEHATRTVPVVIVTSAATDAARSATP